MDGSFESSNLYGQWLLVKGLLWNNISKNEVKLLLNRSLEIQILKDNTHEHSTPHPIEAQNRVFFPTLLGLV